MLRKIFICYREQDAVESAFRLFEFLNNELPDQVFIDHASIETGEDFELRINAQLDACDILLAVIGKGWITAADDKGIRLGRPDDYVCYEIVGAMKRQKEVLPVLVTGAGMPRESDLPDVLRAARFAKRHAHSIDPKAFNDSVSGLVRRIKKLLEAAETERRATRSQALSVPQGAEGLSLGQLGRQLSNVLLPNPGHREAISDNHMRLVHSCWRRPDRDAQFNGQRMYQIHVRLFASQGVLGQIERVEYQLDDAYPPELRQRTVQRAGEAINAAKGFGFYDLANGYSIVKARVFVSGQPAPIELSRFVSMAEIGPNLNELAGTFMQ